LHHPTKQSAKVQPKMIVKATALHAFHGNPAQKQISFPAGAEIEADRNRENNGWMAGSYRGQKGWFPVSYVSFFPPQQPMPQAQAQSQPLWQQHPQPSQQMHPTTRMIPNRNMENLPVGGGASAFPDHVYNLVDWTGQNRQQPPQQQQPAKQDFVDWSGQNQQAQVVQPAAVAPFGAAATTALWTTTTPSYSPPQSSSSLAYVQDDDFCFGNQEIMGGLGSAIARQAPLQPISNYKNDNDNDQDYYNTYQDSGKGKPSVVVGHQPLQNQHPQQNITPQQPPKNKSGRFRFFTKKG
jgi:Variant SH3 domain